MINLSFFFSSAFFIAGGGFLWWSVVSPRRGGTYLQFRGGIDILTLTDAKNNFIDPTDVLVVSS